jgi:pteridine reductase
VLAAMTRMMALEFAPNITVNAVAPGLVLPPPGKDESFLQSLVHTVPLQRHGEAQDIADAIAFLVQSDFITGNVIYVDGGRHLHEYSDGSHPH